MKKLSKIPELSVVLIGIILVIIGVGIKLYIGFTAMGCTEKTLGVTIDYDEEYDYIDNQRRYYGIYSYYVDGVAFEFRNNVAEYSEPSIGEEVALYYNPLNPDQCYVEDTSWISNAICWSCIIIGVIISVLAVCVFLVKLLCNRVKRY